MSEPNARERIAHIIEFGTEEESPWVDDPGETRADAIIDIVREAMFSQVGTIAVSLDKQPGISTKSLHAHHLALADALDAAFGADDDGGEE